MNYRSLRVAVAVLLAASVPLSSGAQTLVPGSVPTAAPTVAPTEVPAEGAPLAGVDNDLTHPTFTATTGLVAMLVSPEAGGSASIARPIEVSTVAGAGVELAVGGDVAPFSKIGKRTVDKKTGETHYYYYGIALEPGENTVVLTPLGANGARGPSRAYVLYGPGKPVSLDVRLVGSLRADGKTPATLHVVALDQWHHPAMAGLAVKATIVGGDARFDTTAAPNPRGTDAPPDVASAPASIASPSVTVPGVAPIDADATQSFATHTDADGVADIEIVPGLRAGDVALRVSALDLFVDTRVHVAPYLRAPIVAGVASAGIGAVPGIPGDVAGAPEGASSRLGRIALYASGSIADRALATVAYDTADTLTQTIGNGPFVDNPDERPYQTYGDASTRRDDALSRDHLFARLDLDRSSAMWGEFRATTGSSDAGTLGGFDLLVNGAKLDLERKDARVQLFQARNDIAYARQVYQPTGLSTLGIVLHPNIVVGSDTITLVTFDRHSGAIATETTLTRNVDYVLDYGSGNFRFVTIPLPFDQNFNPQQVLLQYEYQGSGIGAETTGGRLDLGGQGRAVRAGVGYVDDATGTGNVTLLGENVRGALPGGAWSIEHLASRGALASTTPVLAGAAGFIGTGGDAWKATAAAVAGPNKLSLAYEATSAGFNNPFGGIATPGLTNYSGTYVRTFRTGDLTAHVDHNANVGVGYANAETDAGIHLHERVRKRLTFGIGVDRRSYAGGSSYVAPQIAGQPVDPTPTTPPTALGTIAALGQNPTGAVTQADVQVDYRISPTVDLSLGRIADVGGTSDAALSQPSQTTAQLGVDFPKKGRAYVRELWSGAPTQSFAAASSSLTTQALATRSTAIGFERSLGSATSVDTEYVVDHTGSGSDIFEALGVKERFIYTKRFNGDVTVQRGNAIGGSASGFNLYGATLAYTGGDRFRGTGSYQLRTGSAPGVTFAVAAAGALTQELSVIGAVDDARSNGFVTNDDRISLAFRPAQNDASVALFGYERRTGNASTLNGRTDVLSLEELLRPTARLEVAGRYAYKLDGDGYYAAHTSLVGVRVDQRIGDRFDLASEVRALSVHDVAGASSTAFAVEGGARLGQAMRFALGYNFEGSPDPSLARAPTRRGAYATITSAIDSLFGFGARR